MNKWLKNSIFLALILSSLFFVSYVSAISYLVPITLITSFIYLRYQKKLTKHKGYNYLGLSLLLVIVIFANKFIVSYSELSVYYTPIIAIAMLCTILFNDLMLSMVLIIAASICAGLISGVNLYLTSVLFIGGMFASFLVINVRRRSQIIKAGVAAGVIQIMCLIFISFAHAKDYSIYILPNIINGLFSGIFVTGVLPVFEYLFNVVTNITLLELSDFNHPLLKRMVLEAPGTYHHSLIVGNLSEAAAEVIGANALLARIGSYYHDIGKIEKAEYFIENQSMENMTVHDQLKPSISKMVIMNHVREGKDLARKYKLNDSIVDFITQHHGTSLVFYFYWRALENSGEHKEDVEEEGFRYGGPKPQTKEAAIVLLADSVEGATRALKERTPKKIDELVRKVVNNKFIDGQLDECDLTLSDLEVIASTFSKILAAVYHARITYPEDKSENNDNKPAE